MEYFPFVHEKPKPKNEPIPLYQEIEAPDNHPLRKKEKENEEKEERGVVIIQL